MFYGSALMAGARGLLRQRPRDLLACGLLAGLRPGLQDQTLPSRSRRWCFWTPVAYALVMRREPLGKAGLARFWASTYVPLLARSCRSLIGDHPFVMAALGTLLLLVRSRWMHPGAWRLCRGSSWRLIAPSRSSRSSPRSRCGPGFWAWRGADLLWAGRALLA